MYYCSLINNTNFLGDGKSVVIDNTHVNQEAREKYVEMASKFKIPCRCFVMATTLGQVRALIRIQNKIHKTKISL